MKMKITREVVGEFDGGYADLDKIEIKNKKVAFDGSVQFSDELADCFLRCFIKEFGREGEQVTWEED
jgi:hypothetical protein